MWKPWIAQYGSKTTLWANRAVRVFLHLGTLGLMSFTSVYGVVSSTPDRDMMPMVVELLRHNVSLSMPYIIGGDWNVPSTAMKGWLASTQAKGEAVAPQLQRALQGHHQLWTTLL